MSPPDRVFSWLPVQLLLPVPPSSKASVQCLPCLLSILSPRLCRVSCHHAAGAALRSASCCLGRGTCRVRPACLWPLQDLTPGQAPQSSRPLSQGSLPSGTALPCSHCRFLSHAVVPPQTFTESPTVLTPRVHLRGISLPAPLRPDAPAPPALTAPELRA